MQKIRTIIPLGLILAGFTNIVGVIVFTQGFTNSTAQSYMPELFSTPSLMLIMLWGLAYILLGKRYQRAPSLLLVFALEKLVYAGYWLQWFLQHPNELTQIAEHSILTATFLGIFGPVDLFFSLFFLWALWTTRRSMHRLDDYEAY